MGKKEAWIGIEIYPEKRAASVTEDELESDEKAVDWYISAVCNSERRRLNLVKSQFDSQHFKAGHEGIGKRRGSHELFALMPHSNCVTRGLADTGREMCVACSSGQENLCRFMRHAGLDSGEPGTLSNWANVDDGQLIPIGTSLTDWSVIFIEPLACVMRSWGRINEAMYDGIGEILVVGGGPIGCLHTKYCLKKYGSSVTLLEKNPIRRQRLKKIFAEEPGVNVVSSLDGAQYFSVSVMAASDTSAYITCRDHVISDGALLLFSGFNEPDFSDGDVYPEIIHRNEFVYYGPTFVMTGSSGYVKGDIERSKKMILNGDIDLRNIITGMVYGLTSDTVVCTETEEKEYYDTPIVLLDMAHELSHHIKLVYVNSPSMLESHPK